MLLESGSSEAMEDDKERAGRMRGVSGSGTMSEDELLDAVACTSRIEGRECVEGEEGDDGAKRLGLKVGGDPSLSAEGGPERRCGCFRRLRTIRRTA